MAEKKPILATKTGEVIYRVPPEKGDPGPQGATGPFYYPSGEWDARTNYLRTEAACPYVICNKQYYYRKTLGPCIGKNPQEDVAGPQLYWDVMTNQKAAFYEIFFAEFGKLASFIFNGDYMMSQQGLLNGAPSSDYEQFNPNDLTKFIPNILMNAMTGYAHFGHGNLKVNADGSVEMVGSFSTGNKGNRIVLDPATRSLKMIREDNTTALEVVFSSGEGVIWSEIRMSGHRGSQVLIDSIGNVRMTSTTGDRCDFETTEGIEFTHDGETLRYPSFIQCQDISSSTHVINDLTSKNATFYRVINSCTISLPDATKSKGRSIKFKNLRAVVNFQDNPKRATLYPSNGMTPVDTVTTDAASTYEWYCDGRYWYLFFCK